MEPIVKILEEIVKERQSIYDRLVDVQGTAGASATEVSLARIDLLEAKLRLAKE